MSLLSNSPLDGEACDFAAILRPNVAVMKAVILGIALAAFVVQAEAVRIDATDRMANSGWIDEAAGTRRDGTPIQGTVLIDAGLDGTYTAHFQTRETR
jgi:hypothetical protein